MSRAREGTRGVPAWNPAEVKAAYLALVGRTPLEVTQGEPWGELLDELIAAEEQRDMLAFRRAIGRWDAGAGGRGAP